MAVSNKVGRPRYVADIKDTNPAQYYCNKFYKACRKLSYHEMSALAQYLGMEVRTMYRWRAGESFPRELNTMLVVIRWVRDNKPIITQSQEELHKPSLFD